MSPETLRAIPIRGLRLIDISFWEVQPSTIVRFTLYMPTSLKVASGFFNTEPVYFTEAGDNHSVL